MRRPLSAVGSSASTLIPPSRNALRSALGSASHLPPDRCPLPGDRAPTRRRHFSSRRCRLRLRKLPGAFETVRAAALAPLRVRTDSKARTSIGTERLLAHLRLRIRSGLRLARIVAPCRQPRCRLKKNLHPRLRRGSVFFLTRRFVGCPEPVSSVVAWQQPTKNLRCWQAGKQASLLAMLQARHGRLKNAPPIALNVSIPRSLVTFHATPDRVIFAEAA